MIPENEFAPYYKNYIQPLAENGKSIVENLLISQNNFEQLLQDIPLEKQLFAYDTGKWTIKEVVQHIIDTERVFCYRALCFARNDKTALPGFDQDLFAANDTANARNWQHLLKEMHIVRQGTIILFSSFSQEALLRIGSGSGKNMSVRAIGFLCSGHQLHHLKVLQESYF